MQERNQKILDNLGELAADARTSAAEIAAYVQPRARQLMRRFVGEAVMPFIASFADEAVVGFSDAAQEALEREKARAKMLERCVRLFWAAARLPKLGPTFDVNKVAAKIGIYAREQGVLVDERFFEELQS